FYNITLIDKSFLALNTRLQSGDLTEKDYDFLICSFVSRRQIVEIRNSILIILIIVISLITLLLIVLTSYYGKMIIKPINRLIQATGKIARKQFNEKIHLKTGDEFEVLGNAINTMAQSLEERDIEQKKFYEAVSHDIKTPLTVISGYAQGLKTDIFKDKDQTLDKIIEECQELKKQLENVIFLSKLDTVKESYKFEQLEMNNLIIESLNNVESLIILDEIDVDFTPVTDILFKGDRQKLLKAFVNILTNCIKYTSDLIIIKVEKKKSTVCVTIQDNGPGFSDEILQNAFSRDYIGEKDGTGIGLSIVKRVIEGHQGTLSLENDPSLGAIYRIQLPL
ncbi:MAG: HAMP domain-containing sensor histidine kinase, partial [Thermotogota bacterium]|nr:HAMP domain-containing sensor histidine kinase [Thermotogota bacterium]